MTIEDTRQNQKGVIRYFPNVSCMGTHAFRCVEDFGDVIRAEPCPNNAKPPSASHSSWGRKEWLTGQLRK